MSGWHERRPTSKHQNWFRGLAELHEITHSWINELQVERPSYALARGLNAEVAQDLWMLESFSGKGLDTLLDETTPDDVLGRLERTVWSAQAWTLMRLMDRTSASERPSLISMLEQTAWKAGRKSGELRWAKLPREAREDMRGLLLALVDSPFVGSHALTLHDTYLIRRSLAHEVQLELKQCPHRSPYEELRPVADELCLIQSYFLRGYLYALNSKVSIEHRLGDPSVAEPRCWQRWFFVS